MNFIIFDLEATCVENDRSFQNETIEIGAVKLDSDLRFLNAFNCAVKPKLNPVLSDFCKKLTTIEQKWVDEADDFPTCIKDFREWIDDDYLLCSWGFYDRNQFINDSILHKLEFDWVNRHISLKHQFAKFMNIKPCGMVKAAKMANIELIGIHHRGIDDAINIAKIFKKYFDKWEFPK